MFEDPAFPSLPPPPEDDSVKSMSIVAAGMWAVGAQLVFLWVLLLAALLKGENIDLVSPVISQVVGYLFVLYLVLRSYAPNTSIRSMLAIRETNPWFYVLAIVIGLATIYPCDWLYEQGVKLVPREEPLLEWLDVYFGLPLPERLASVFGMAAVGPVVEEVLFRGALYRPMRVDKRPALVIAVTTLLFALVHVWSLDALYKLPFLIVMGSILGYMRWASGSLVPPILLHVAFNAVPFIELLRYETREAVSEAPSPISYVTAGAGVAALALLFTQALAKSSRRASAARRDDS